jgi:signal transduction histidine kinase
MMGVLFAVFAVLFVMLNLFMQAGSSRLTEELLRIVAEQDGLTFYFQSLDSDNDDESNFNLERMHAGRFFYVKVSKQGKILETNYDMIFDFSESESLDLAKSALKKNQEKGAIGNFQYLVASKDYGHIVVFAERSIEEQMLSRLVAISGWVALSTFGVLFVFSLILSGWAVKPISVAFDKQRRFISDASHELKTPLTILNANVDVLENGIGENPRLENIKTQSARMNHLIQSLLTLAKTDEGNAQIIFHQFDLSKTILSIALEFESRAFEEGKQYDVSIEEQISYTGEMQQIRQLASILIDNALNYSRENGQIQISLKTEGGKRIFSVFNTGEGIQDQEKSHIFERFYRSDESRSRETGGYGLGLSIAKSITDAHKGKITVDGKAGDWVRFTVIL